MLGKVVIGCDQFDTYLCMEDDADRWEDKVDDMVAGGKYMVYGGLRI